jgi:hypothetical protein
MNGAFRRRTVRGAIAVAVLVAGTLVGIGVVEGGLRFQQWRQRATVKGYFWERHPDYGWRLVAGRAGRYFDDDGQFATDVRINRLGLRDIERAYDKPAGAYRILVLGDSYMEALQVELEETFARLLEAELAGPVEVINAGVSAYGTDNALLFFIHEGHKFQPDLVLLSFSTGNDVHENYEPFHRQVDLGNMNKPAFHLNAAGELVMTPGPPLPPPVPWWRRNLRVGEWLYTRMGGTIQLSGANPFALRPPADPEVPYVAADLFIYAPAYRPEVVAAWRVTEALLLRLRDEVRQRGAELAVVVGSPPWVHDDGYWGLRTMRHAVARATWDRQKPRRIVDAFLAEQAIPFVDLYEVFEREKNRVPLFFTIDPHWTPAGHRLAAQTTAEFLRQKVPRRRR